MIKIKNITLLILAPVFATFNCKKMTVENPTIPPDSKISGYVPVKLETKTQAIELKYLGNTSSLSEIKNTSTGRKEVLKYNKDNVLSAFEVYENDNLTYRTDYFRDAKKRVTTISQFKINGAAFTPIGNSTLSYNQQDQIAEIKSYNAGNILLSIKTLKYDERSNLIGVAKDFPVLPAENNSFMYDQKNAIFKYVPEVQLVSMESQYKFFGCIVNNLLISSGEKTYGFGYIYNSDNYPQQFTFTVSNSQTTYKVSYKKLTD